MLNYMKYFGEWIIVIACWIMVFTNISLTQLFSNFFSTYFVLMVLWATVELMYEWKKRKSKKHKRNFNVFDIK